MKVYLLLVLVVAASALGCIGQKQADSTKASASTTEKPVSSSLAENESLEIESDLAQMDSMFNDSVMDISFSEVNADAFT